MTFPKERFNELKENVYEWGITLETERRDLEASDKLMAFEKNNDKWIHLMTKCDWNDESVRDAASNEIKSKIKSIETFSNGWIWNRKTFDMALRWLQPEFKAMYLDVEGHLPRYSDSGFQQIIPDMRKHKHLEFFLVHWRNGESHFHVPHFEELKGFARPLGYRLEPDNSMKADTTSMEGDDKREPFELNPRALGFEMQNKFEAGIEERFLELDEGMRVHHNRFLEFKETHEMMQIKKVESYGDDKSRFNAYSMKQRKGFELTKKESRELYRLGQKFSSK